MSDTTVYLNTIKQKLYQLRKRFYLVISWHCFLFFSLTLWLTGIVYLAIRGSFIWPIPVFGVIVTVIYSGYRLYHRPSLPQLAYLADRRCGMQDGLITAWEYQDNRRVSVPFLLEYVCAKLGEVKPGLIYNFRLFRRWWGIPLFFLLLSAYFYHYPVYKPTSIASTKQHINIKQNKQAVVLNRQLAKFRQELKRNKLSKLADMTQRLEKLAIQTSEPEKKAETITALKELKKEIENSLPKQDKLPQLPPQIKKQENKKALIELEITSDNLLKLISKLNLDGISEKEIENKALRALAGIIDRLIQINIPGKNGNKKLSGGKKTTQTTYTVKKTKRPAGPLKTAGAFPKYNMSNQRGYSSKAGRNIYSAFSANNISKKDYSNLAAPYQKQVNAVISDQSIPPVYRKQVMEYFHALR